MTRKTFYRHLLAWSALAIGLPAVYYWLLPAKSKWPGWLRFDGLSWRYVNSASQALGRAIERDLAVYLRHTDALAAGTGRVGDTIAVRKPQRFCR